MIRYIATSVILFSILYAFPWFGALKDEVRLSLAAAIAVTGALFLDLLLEVLAAPGELYRSAKMAAVSANSALEHEQDRRPFIEARLVYVERSKVRNAEVRIRVTNRGESGKFSAHVEVEQKTHNFFPQSSRMKALWSNEKHSPTINYGDHRDIALLEVSNSANLAIFYRDRDDDAHAVTKSIDRTAISCLPISVTISSEPRAKNGVVKLRYSLSAWLERTADKRADTKISLVDLDGDKWGPGRMLESDV